MLQAKQSLVDAVKQGLGANTEQLRKVGAAGTPQSIALHCRRIWQHFHAVHAWHPLALSL